MQGVVLKGCRAFWDQAVRLRERLRDKGFSGDGVLWSGSVRWGAKAVRLVIVVRGFMRLWEVGRG